MFALVVMVTVKVVRNGCIQNITSELGLLMIGCKLGFPGGTSGKEPTCQCRRCKRLRFRPFVRKIPWRRAWQPTPLFLPRESHGQRGLVGYSPLGCKESDTMTEQLTFTLLSSYIKESLEYLEV